MVYYGGGYDEGLLRKEKTVYEILSNTDFVPKIVRNDCFKEKSCDSFYITEYIQDSSSIRQMLIACKDSPDHCLNYIGNLIDIYRIFTDKLQESYELFSFQNGDVFKQLTSRFSNLLLSGPNAGCDKKWRRFRNKVLQRIFTKVHREELCNIADLCCIDRKVVHGDFHLNNFILDENSTIFLIDFENVNNGSQEIELAYMYAQIWGIIEDKTTIDAVYSRLSSFCYESGLNVDAFQSISQLYIAGIALNHTFMTYQIRLGNAIKAWRRALNCLKYFKKYFKND